MAPRRPPRSRSRSATSAARASRHGTAVRGRGPRRRRGLRAAYEDEDGAALAAPAHPRRRSACSPAASPAAARRIVNEYERQFRAQRTTRGYELDDLEVRAAAGPAARAALPRRPQAPRRDRGPDRVRRRPRPRPPADRADRRHAVELSAQQARATRTRHRRAAPHLGARRRVLLAYAHAASGTSGSRKPPPRSRSTLSPRPRRCARRRRRTAPTRSGTRDPLLARDAEGGEGGHPAARPGGDVDHVRPRLERDPRREAAAAHLRAAAQHLHPRGARADRPADLHAAAEHERGVRRARSRSFTGGFGFGGGSSRRTRRQRRPRGPRR